MPSKTPRVAICGMKLESNAFSPVATEADFQSLCYLEGEDIMVDARSEAPTVCPEIPGFIRAMDVTGDWTPVPLAFAWSHPWGPADHDFFERTVKTILQGIQDAGGVDAIYVANHGAMLTTQNKDPDGELLARLRKAVGPNVPIISTLDLHANVSQRSAKSADVLVSYLTNPHVDQLERGEEAAHIVRGMLGRGISPHTAYIKLPIAAPTVTLLTREGPYADLIDYGQRRKRELGGEILNVSITAGFVFGDSPDTGMSVVVTGRHALGPAQDLANDIAQRAWKDRQRFQRTLTSLDDAVQSAVARGHEIDTPAKIYAQVADNPGGGGGGDTIELLEALSDAKAKNVLYGSFFDSALANAAHTVGEGNTFNATFNREPRNHFAKTWDVDAKVLKLSNEPFVGRLGLFAGTLITPQPSAALQIGGDDGIVVIVISNRYQTADPMFFEHHGFDISKARTVVVKSRGHFRAGFSPFFDPEHVIEVDTPGFASPILSRFEWTDLPRPSYPLDVDAQWKGEENG